ncbi:tryptophan 2,3-dioxygenase [Janthinobacterium sp.]|uniref:tryptophan 2,3-dioxygenase n=1 Tax=Janthinobacterium sp. TaxID=1871054 RepID=UPI00293D9704|nr:tryptophan 2,3-dioxygenase [Janthinobacterium sp.]
MSTEKKGACTWHGAQMDFSKSMSYGDYLALDQILTAQHPLSPNHNEMLFIVQHQTSELWMKLMLHELHAVRANLRSDDLAPAFKMLARVARIMDQLVHAWDVLATMTPPEYTAIRPYLGASSGFQSYQYREIEFILGNKNAALLDVHTTAPEPYALLDAALRAPSLYDESVQLLARQGFAIAPERLDADWTQPTAPDESVKAAWLAVYQDPAKHWALYELAEKLVDMETAFRFWRFRHVTTVERIIGFKTGTGGTAGVSYLRKMLDVVLFPELFSLRTAL